MNYDMPYAYACTCFSPPCFLVRSDLPWAGGALDLSVLSVSYVLQRYNIARSMHVVFITYVAGRQQYGTCSPACMYKSSLTSSLICILYAAWMLLTPAGPT
jgi:hypothetical protein